MLVAADERDDGAAPGAGRAGAHLAWLELAPQPDAQASAAPQGAPAPTGNWLLFRTLVARWLAGLWSDLAWDGSPAAPEDARHDELGSGDVLDGETDRLEGGDGLVVARR